MVPLEKAGKVPRRCGSSWKEGVWLPKQRQGCQNLGHLSGSPFKRRQGLSRKRKRGAIFQTRVCLCVWLLIRKSLSGCFTENRTDTNLESSTPQKHSCRLRCFARGLLTEGSPRRDAEWKSSAQCPCFFSFLGEVNFKTSQAIKSQR